MNTRLGFRTASGVVLPRHPQPPTARTMRQATGARVVGAPILPPEPARPVATRCVNRGEGRQGTGAHPNGRAHGSRCPTSGGIGRRPCPRFSWAGGGGLKNGIVRRIRPPRSFTRAAAKLATPLFWAAPAPLSPMCRRQRVSGDRAGFIRKKTASFGRVSWGWQPIWATSHCPLFSCMLRLGSPKYVRFRRRVRSKARQLLLFGLSPSAPLGCCIASEKKSPRPGGEGRKSHTKGWRQTRTPACDSQRDASPCSNFPTSK